MTQEFKSIDSHIKLLKEQFDSVGKKFNCLTWGRIKASHESYAQQYVDEAETFKKGFEALQEAVLKSAERNKELVEILRQVVYEYEQGEQSFKTILEIKELLKKQS